MNIVVSPCNQSGKGQEDEFFVDEAKELLDKPYHFKVRARISPNNIVLSVFLYITYSTSPSGS